MKTNKKKLKKVFAVLALLSLFISENKALAIGIDSIFGHGSIGSILDEVEERYGYDPNSLRRSKRKVTVPEVNIFFDNPEPQEGEKVTATAVPSNFKDVTEELYYTWYIIHTDDDGDPVDTDGDGTTIDEIENGKIEAMGRAARGSFDPVLFGITSSDYSSGDQDSDAFLAPIGGLNGVGAKSEGDIDEYEQMNQKGVVDTETITRCYRHNFGTKSDVDNVEAGGDGNSGRDMVVGCDHKFPQFDSTTRYLEVSIGSDENSRNQSETLTLSNCSTFKVGDESFTSQEEACWKLDPTNPDTDGDGVEDEADLAGLNQQQFAWNYQNGDRIGVVIEGMSMNPTNEDTLNSYYKIMWAMPGLCNSEEEGYIENDECDSSSDYEFNFLQAMEVKEYAEENLETNLQSSPNNAQFDPFDDDYSDEITISAILENNSIDDRFVYYDWEIYRCKDNNSTESCITTQVYDTSNPDSNLDKNLWLTRDCQSGLDDQDLSDCGILTTSVLDGLGAKEITFRPRTEIMMYSKEYFKVVLRTSRKKVDSRYAISDVVVPITQNDVGLKLYTVKKNDSGVYSLNQEICTEGLYKKVCPVYPYQVVGAQAKSRSGIEVESYSWSLNNNFLSIPTKCVFDYCDSDSPIIYFPVLGSSLFVGGVSVTAKRKNGEDLVSQRAFSINEPLAIIYSNDISVAWPFVKFNDVESADTFESYPKTKVIFRADLIPDYLILDEDVSLVWFLNGNEVTEEFIKENDDWELELDGNKISFITNGKIGSDIELIARVKKEFTDDEKELLDDAWDIIDTDDLIKDARATIKLTYPADFFQNEEGEATSLKMFFASTAKNAPEYLLFSIRLAVIMVFGWSLFFGLDYGLKTR